MEFKEITELDYDFIKTKMTKKMMLYTVTDPRTGEVSYPYIFKFTGSDE